MPRPDRAGRATLVEDVRVKARLDHRLVDDALCLRTQRALAAGTFAEIERTFGFVPRAHERFKIVRYDAGRGWFTAHRDNITPDAEHRRLAVTIGLSDDYLGGELCFPELDEMRCRPSPGGAIVFPCELLHEVRPVTDGARHALLTFLW